MTDLGLSDSFVSSDAPVTASPAASGVLNDGSGDEGPDITGVLDETPPREEAPVFAATIAEGAVPEALEDGFSAEPEFEEPPSPEGSGSTKAATPVDSESPAAPQEPPPAEAVPEKAAESDDAPGDHPPDLPADFEGEGSGRLSLELEAEPSGRPSARAEGSGRPSARAEGEGSGRPSARVEGEGSGRPSPRAEEGDTRPSARAEVGSPRASARVEAEGSPCPSAPVEADGSGRPSARVEKEASPGPSARVEASVPSPRAPDPAPAEPQPEDRPPAADSPPGSPRSEGEDGLHVTDDVPTLSLLRPSPQFTESELDSVIARLLKTHGSSFKHIPLEMRRPLFEHIHRRRVQAIEQQRYEDADGLQRAAELLRRAIAAELLDNDIVYEQKTLSVRLRDARDVVNRTRQLCADRLQQLDVELREREEDLRARHNREIANFPTEWDNPSGFHEWNKASPQLLQMRQQEKSMALIGDFVGAKEMKRRIDRLEKSETDAAQDRAKQAMELAFQQLVDRHARESDGQARLRHRLWVQAMVENQAELRPLDAAVKKLEALQGSKPLRKSPPVSRSQLVARRNPEPGRDDRPIVQTPRTTQKMHVIRVTPRGDVLALKKVETTGFVRTHRPKEEKHRPKKVSAADF